jgi:hypothetical protein
MKDTPENFSKHLDEEAERLILEALEDQDKMDILEIMLGEEVANTASAPGLAMVSDGEPVSPRYKQREFGKGIWRRKKKKEPVFETSDIKLSLDIANTSLMETHYVVYGVDDINVDQVLSLIPSEELEMLAEGAKRKIVIRGGKKRIVFKCPAGQKLAKKGGKACVKMGGAEKARRSKQAKRAARKAKKSRAAANRKRAKSMKKRKSMVRR